MNDEYLDHVVEARDKHLHNSSDNLGINPILLEIHEFFQVATVAVIHKHVVARVGLDCLLQLGHIVTVDSVLILNFTNN